MDNSVLAWQETVFLPTYEIGKAEKNPVFLEKRVYQGSSGALYPHPVIEKIEDEKKEKAYTALFLENAFLKIMILPELGGRVHRAYDKIRNRDFVYYNQVVKPALVGLTGPWISGGIEFNWPQHHRPSTFLPVDFTIKENADGSKTVWVNEVELMFRTKCQAGFTLYPDKAYLEIKGKLYNRSMLPQTFLWWANPAVKVNDHYQSVFPPDVHAVFDHGKRDVSDFPIATGTYYKVDYAPGTDISRYKNIPVPTSYMAIRSDYDFVGGYEHDTQAGILHVANHHISPGKKQWTWGHGEFGKAWDRNLTDEDGPYIELMTGVFTDNQPDFSWLHPNEEKTFEQYFMPYAKAGLVKNATKDAMINVELIDRTISLVVYATGSYQSCTINVFEKDGDIIQSFQTNVSPSEIFETSFQSAHAYKAHELCVEVLTAGKELLVSYEYNLTDKQELPEAATAAKHPTEIASIEELYLNGLHIEQYRHATYKAIDYYEEALRREPNDSRCNNAMGVGLLRNGQFTKAEYFLRKAIKTITSRNPNPFDGEAYYNLGLCLKLQGKLNEAYEAFYKSTWNDAFQHSGFFQLARIDAAKNNVESALQLIEKSLIRNYHSHSARHLKSVLLRKLKRSNEAEELIRSSLEIDPFNFGCYFEGYLLCMESGEEEKALTYLSLLKTGMRNAVNNYLEYAFDYSNAGFYNEAAQLLGIYLEANEEVNPLVYYSLSYFKAMLADEVQSIVYAKLAHGSKPDYCFPNKLEELVILRYAVQTNPGDDKAWYYLGCLWHGMRNHREAIEAYEKSIAIEPGFPTAHRNLSLLYYNKESNPQKALKALETAFALDQDDARVLMELDQLCKRLSYPLQQRLDFLNKHCGVVAKRDDLYLEKITLENCLGNCNAAKQMLEQRIFHPWEGGEGKVVGQYLICHLELAKQAIVEQNYDEAIKLLLAAKEYPHNLGEGKLQGAQENDIHYLLGYTYEAMGQQEEAFKFYTLASQGISEPVQAIFYNDPQPDKILYQGLAFLKLDDTKKAEEIFERVIEFGTQHMKDDIKIDYFAVSLPDLLVFDTDLNERNKNHCRYMIGLGYLGKANYNIASKQLHEVLHHDCSHAGAIVHLSLLEFLRIIDEIKIPVFSK